MAIGTLSVVASIGGIIAQQRVVKTADHTNVYGGDGVNIPLPAGKSVSNWVKTDADTAAGDLEPGHGYTTGKMDVFWTTAEVAKRRYDVDVVVASDALALDGGVGDDFPATAVTDVIVCEVVQIDTKIDGDNVKLLVISSTVIASVYFEETGGSSIMQCDVTPNDLYTWHDTQGDANPMTGNPITVCFASNGSLNAGILVILLLEDSTP